MKRFGGFPPKLRFTAVPEVFLSLVLPDISDAAEIKVVLTFFRLLCHKKGYPRFVTRSEIASEADFMSSLAADSAEAHRVLEQALGAAVERGVLVSASVETGEGKREAIYLLNSQADREALAKLEAGQISLPGLAAVSEVRPAKPKLPDIFTLYEENIGMITPVIAEELRIAREAFPEEWVRDAIKEAANQNKRRWSYISAILERWRSEGKTDGTYRRDIKKGDPDKYIKGKYGHMVQR